MNTRINKAEKLNDTYFCKGILVLVPCEKEDALFFRIHDGYHLLSETNLKASNLVLDLNFFMPIIISETEGDSKNNLYACYNTKKQKFGHYGGEDFKYNKLILAKSEELPLSLLQSIVDGSLKENDEVQVECESKTEDLCDGVVFHKDYYSWYEIKYNDSYINVIK